jgi:lipopolysaccharide/colanic/teichoic acid biosynthesis glycosyltransferase
MVGVVILPLTLAIALAVKLTSRGPAFYGHRRVGQGGQEIQVWKFRSMVTNADAVLAAHLAAHPDAQIEWQQTQKLVNDPRVTPLGAWLRKTSLDELPQLWNVLKGDMSLVGPRPIIHSECRHYGEFMELYDSVPPGLSGLWQVSGRSNTSYAQRVELDVAYVRNWSFWLDLYILARTVPSVLAARGAC